MKWTEFTEKKNKIVTPHKLQPIAIPHKIKYTYELHFMNQTMHKFLISQGVRLYSVV